MSSHEDAVKAMAEAGRVMAAAMDDFAAKMMVVGVAITRFCEELEAAERRGVWETQFGPWTPSVQASLESTGAWVAPERSGR